jgi:hypothetical protein
MFWIVLNDAPLASAGVWASQPDGQKAVDGK